MTPHNEYRVQWTGSRNGRLRPLVWEVANAVERHADDRLLTLIFGHGNAIGVDTDVDVYSNAKGVERRIWLADWGTHGRRAGILRNEQMVDEFKPTLGVGLNWNDSPGTRHCVSYMKSKGIPVLSIEYTGDPEGKVFPF